MPNLSPMHRTKKHKSHKGGDIRQQYKHLYGTTWNKYRAVYLKSNPLCVCSECKDKVVAAEVVDHIIPHRGDEQLFWDTSNHQPLSKRCHDKKTMKEVRERSGI